VVDVKAMSVRRGFVDSPVATAVLSLRDMVSTPAITPAPAPYSEIVEVTLTCSTPGSTILYTLDGSEPDPAALAPASAELPLSAGAERGQDGAPAAAAAPAPRDAASPQENPPDSAPGASTVVVYDPAAPLRITAVGSTLVRARAVRSRPARPPRARRAGGRAEPAAQRAKMAQRYTA
jgi:hypothetical protein